MKLRINKETIDTAEKRNAHRCMIAQAIKEQVPHATAVQVDLQSIRYSDPSVGVRSVFLTPIVAQKALLKFDQGEHVEPFEVQIPKPAIVRPVGLTLGHARQHTQTARRGARKDAHTARNRVPQREVREFGIKMFKDVTEPE